MILGRGSCEGICSSPLLSCCLSQQLQREPIVIISDGDICTVDVCVHSESHLFFLNNATLCLFIFSHNRIDSLLPFHVSLALGVVSMSADVPFPWDRVLAPLQDPVSCGVSYPHPQLQVRKVWQSQAVWFTIDLYPIVMVSSTLELLRNVATESWWVATSTLVTVWEECRMA